MLRVEINALHNKREKKSRFWIKFLLPSVKQWQIKQFKSILKHIKCLRQEN